MPAGVRRTKITAGYGQSLVGGSVPRRPQHSRPEEQPWLMMRPNRSLSKATSAGQSPTHTRRTQGDGPVDAGVESGHLRTVSPGEAVHGS